ncbi:MAG: hypothetical protein LBS60_04065 [Deltaproteobacteria bacterium]|nr:hypothetical protein [Deltaproteobacteria bacterium]
MSLSFKNSSMTLLAAPAALSLAAAANLPGRSTFPLDKKRSLALGPPGNDGPKALDQTHCHYPGP